LKTLKIFIYCSQYYSIQMQKAAAPNPSQSPTKWVCGGKGKTRSSVDAAVLVPPHDLMALF